MFFRLKDQLQRSQFDFLCRGIFRTPPVDVGKAEVTFVSQVSHRDLLMYLVAIKSLYRFFRRGSIVVLDDGSLTSQDRSHLKQHLRSADILHIRDVALADTPKGGTWERLTLISQLVKDSYVVQVDSDSVNINAIPEVLEYVAANSSFTLLGAGSYPGIEPMPNAAQRAQQNGSKSAEPQA